MKPRQIYLPTDRCTLIAGYDVDGNLRTNDFVAYRSKLLELSQLVALTYPRTGTPFTIIYY